MPNMSITPIVEITLQIGPIAQDWRWPSQHGEGLRAMAKPSPWRDFYGGDIARDGDTHHHLATRINLWRHPSPYGDTFPDLATGVAKARQPRELDHIFAFSYYPVRMLSKRSQAGEI